MVKVRTDNGYADFVAKILAPNGMSFHIVDRYSSMRKFQSLLRNSLSDTVNLNDLPPFPKKKMMGAMDPTFLEARKNELGLFFNI